MRKAKCSFWCCVLASCCRELKRIDLDLVLEIELVSIMAHRNSSMLPTPESHPNHPSNPQNPNLQRHFESTTMRAATENTMFNHSVRLPNPHAANSGAFHDQYHYPLSTAGSSQSLPYSAQYAPYCYDQRAYGNGVNMVCPQAENGRVSFKRKNATAHPAYQNDYGYCSSGSAATFPDPQNNFQLKPISGCCWPQTSTSIANSHPSDTFLSAGEQHQRNVRSRHGDASHNPTWQSSSSNPPHQVYTSVNNSGQWRHPPLPGTYSQWIHPTGAGCSSYVMNQSVVGNVFTGGNTNNHGAYYAEQCRNQHSVLLASHASAPRGIVAGPSRYNHLQISGRTNLGVSAAGPVTFSRNQRPPTRNGGLRISNEENARVRWTSQGMDVPRYFNPLDFFDEHRDLRLDIDDMSYEELLALEERIGNVNAGLSENHLSLCLTKSVYCSSVVQEDQDETTCPICLEEYKDKDNLGMMTCQHVYHFSCIKDWLRIKNVCPICKSPALDDPLKHK